MKKEPKQPPGNLANSAEVQAWIKKLEAENQNLGRRNRALLGALAAVLVVWLVVVWGVYQSAVRSYAVLDDVTVSRHPANQGRVDFSFRVVKPGKVYYRRSSGNIHTTVIDYFDRPEQVQRNWSWVYEPGKDIEVALTYRGSLLRSTQSLRLPTSPRADIVVLVDTTGSMSRYIHMLKEKCIGFSRQLKAQALEHRFALIGFGDIEETDWIDRREFTASAEEFQRHVASLKRFDGGDVPESALDAMNVALSLPFDPQAVRRFYLVTDAPFHEAARSKTSVADLTDRLKKENVLLSVFGRAEFRKDYERLLGDSGRFQELEEFGTVLSEGRILED